MTIDEFLKQDRIAARRERNKIDEKRAKRSAIRKRRPNHGKENIALFKRDILRGMSQKEAAARYGMSRSTASKVALGKAHADIKPAR